MKERPILFSGPMVLAILEGRKTQTRRIVKPQPTTNGLHGVYPDKYNHGPKWGFWLPDNRLTEARLWDCPYGIPGDRLWVRESFQPLLAEGVLWKDADYKTGLGYAPNYVATSPVVEYIDASHDDEMTPHITPSIFMPRWASRITLEITDVRVQRLQDISEEDAIAEGVDFSRNPCGFSDTDHFACCNEYPHTGVNRFMHLWDSINAYKHPWTSNPWVWALTFSVIH